MSELVNPSVMMANFATYVDAAKVANKWKTDSRPAAVVLVDLLLPGARTTDNAFLRTFFRSATVTIRRRSKYGDIWALGPVLDGIRSSTPVEKLSWKRQKARCAFILMVFVPLRMMAIWRLDPTTERPGKSAGVIEVMTRDKTDSARPAPVPTAPLPPPGAGLLGEGRLGDAVLLGWRPPLHHQRHGS
jgi:hypothetical protein